MSRRDRVDLAFKRLSDEDRGGLVTFITAGDPDLETSQNLMERLPDSGADIIELGMPFSDPMADGPAIQAASLRALANGASLRKTLDMVARFRRSNDQ
ncbi:MAG: tryptophan synthase subunit alpha, partial [Arenicellales bacterium]